jgi:hypothetical protein
MLALSISSFPLSSFIFLACLSLAAGTQINIKLFMITPRSRIKAQIAPHVVFLSAEEKNRISFFFMSLFNLQ